MTKERKKRTALTKGGIATLILASSVLPTIVVAAETPQETENQTGLKENTNFTQNISLKGKGAKRVIDLSTLYTYTGGEGFSKTDVVYTYDVSKMSGVKATLNGNFLTLEATSNVSVSGSVSVSATLNNQKITKDVPVSITISTQLKDLAIGTSFTIGGMSWVLADPATGKLLSPKFTDNGNWFTAASGNSSTPIDQTTSKILGKMSATEQKALVNSYYPTAFLQTLPKTKPTAAQMASMQQEEMRTSIIRTAYIASATDWYKYSQKYAYTKNIIGDVDTYKNYVLSNGHMAPYKDVGGFTYLYPGEVINNYGTGYVIAAMYINPDINILSGNKIDFANFSYTPAEKFKDIEPIQNDLYLGKTTHTYNLKEYVNSSSYDVDRFTVSTSKLPNGVGFNYDTGTETVTLTITAPEINENITLTVYDKSSKKNVVFTIPVKSGIGAKTVADLPKGASLTSPAVGNLKLDYNSQNVLNNMNYRSSISPIYLPTASQSNKLTPEALQTLLQDSLDKDGVARVNELQSMGYPFRDWVYFSKYKQKKTTNIPLLYIDSTSSEGSMVALKNTYNSQSFNASQLSEFITAFNTQGIDIPVEYMGDSFNLFRDQIGLDEDVSKSTLGLVGYIAEDKTIKYRFVSISATKDAVTTSQVTKNGDNIIITNPTGNYALSISSGLLNQTNIAIPKNVPVTVDTTTGKYVIDYRDVLVYNPIEAAPEAVSGAILSKMYVPSPSSSKTGVESSSYNLRSYFYTVDLNESYKYIVNPVNKDIVESTKIENKDSLRVTGGNAGQTTLDITLEDVYGKSSNALQLNYKVTNNIIPLVRSTDAQTIFVNKKDFKVINLKELFLGYVEKFDIEKLEGSGLIAYVQGDELYLKGTTEGTSSLEIRASNSLGKSVGTSKFIVVAIDGDVTPPTVSKNVEDITLLKGESKTINMSEIFSSLGKNYTINSVSSTGAVGLEKGATAVTLNALEVGESVITLTVTNDFGTSQEVTFEVTVEEDKPKPPATEDTWSFANPDKPFMGVVPTLTVYGGKSIQNGITISKANWVTEETTVTTTHGDIVLKPDGKGNTTVTIPTALKSVTEETKVHVEKDGVNFLDLLVKPQLKIDFNFVF